MTVVGVSTPTARTQTRFGNVTRIPLSTAQPVLETDAPVHGKPRVSHLRQRRASEKPIRPRCEIKKSDASLAEENKQLQEKIEELTAKLSQLQTESEDKRKRWCKTEKSEAEFLFEEQRISERESYEKQMMAMQERLEGAETRLEACRSALESSGINAISFQQVQGIDQVSELELKMSAIGEEVIEIGHKAGSLLSEIEQMFETDDLELCLYPEESSQIAADAVGIQC